jgi:serine/threonine protein kinase
LNAALGGWAGDPNDTMSVDGRLVGTPLYLPPEAVRGRAPDPTFDLWALAIVLYECVTGTNPMRGTTARDTKQRIWNGTVPDPRAYLPDCPSDLAMLFSKLLAPDIRQRPHTARAFKACLQELAAPQPTVPAFAPNA